MTRITFLRRFRWAFTVVPLLGIGLTAWVQSQPTLLDGLDHSLLLYVGFVAVFFGEGVAFLAWSRHFYANGNVRYGEGLVRGMYTILLAFVGWSLFFTSTGSWEPTLLGLELLIVVSSISLTGVLLLVSSSSISIPGVLVGRSFGLVLLLLATIGYVVQVTFTVGWNLVTLAALVLLICFVCIRLIHPE